jgi:hypothetical protein
VRPRGQEQEAKALVLSPVRRLRASQKQFSGFSVVSDGEVRLSGAVLSLELECAIASLGCDRQGAPTHLDGLMVLTQDIPEPCAQVSKDPSEASTIPELCGQAFGFAHEIQRVLVSPERDERDP